MKNLKSRFDQYCNIYFPNLDGSQVLWDKFDSRALAEHLEN